MERWARCWPASTGPWALILVWRRLTSIGRTPGSASAIWPVAGPSSSGGGGSPTPPLVVSLVESGTVRPWTVRSLCCTLSKGRGYTLQLPGSRQASGNAVDGSGSGRRPTCRASCPGARESEGHLTGRAGSAEALHSPLLSLPYRLELNRLEDLGDMVPYLFEDALLAEALEPQIGGARVLRVGLAWQGNPRFPEDWHRSIPLEVILPLSRIEGIMYFVLQRGPGLDQLAGLADLWQPRLLVTTNEEGWGWEHTAAVIRKLDLVITSDSAVAHLAGAMGRPVWVGASGCGRLALAPRPRRQPLVSDNEAIPPDDLASLGGRVRADCRGTCQPESDGSRLSCARG